MENTSQSLPTPIPCSCNTGALCFWGVHPTQTWEEPLCAVPAGLESVLMGWTWRAAENAIPSDCRSSGHATAKHAFVYELFCAITVVWASLVAQLVKNPSAMQETWVQSLGWEIPWRRERLPSPVFWPGEFRGLYSSWGRKESATTKWLSINHYCCLVTQPFLTLQPHGL